jgi:hypothetical protein
MNAEERVLVDGVTDGTFDGTRPRLFDPPGSVTFDGHEIRPSD